MAGIQAAIALASALALGTAACYRGPVVRRYEMKTERLKRGAGLRFAVVSDLHSTAYGYRQRELLHLLRGEEPDCILLPGDILDERIDPRPAWELLRGAAHIAPSFYCPGNHEYRTKRIDLVFRLVERCGVTVLADRLARLDTPVGELLIAGCEDSERALYKDPAYRQEAAVRTAFSGVGRAAGLRILLAHRPERTALYRLLGFDLVVSGHAHGGQARIPYLMNGFFAPGQGFFPPLAGGLYDHGDFRQLVSRGMAGYPPIPRAFNPPELTVLDVLGAWLE